MIDPTFRNINGFFVLLFRAAEIDTTKVYYDMYYMALVEIKDFNALIDNKLFLINCIKHKTSV